MKELTAGLVSRLRGPLTVVLVGLAVVAAALAVIVWLPLDAQVEADVKEALVGYETSREVAWPASESYEPPVGDATKAALAADLERAVRRYAAGDALAAVAPARDVALFLKSLDDDDRWVVTGWDAEIVYFDFVRQTLRGDVVVRAGVRRAHQIGRSSPDKDRIVARRWLWEEDVDIYEYTLHDDGEGWKVVRAEHWGTCGPDGKHVIEGGHNA